MLSPSRVLHHVLPGALLAGGLLLAACSTDSPTAPVQQPGPPIDVGDPEVSAAFEVDNAGDLTVAFTNLSTGADSFQWDFGDGTFSNAVSPVHVYAEEGTYTVTLTASNSTFVDSATQFVEAGRVDEAVVAAFAVEVSPDPADLTAIFTDNSTGDVERFRWDFGDGNKSSKQNPVHTYAKADTYVVTLTVSNAFSSDTASQFVTVPAEDDDDGGGDGGVLPVASFSFTASPDAGDLSVIFENTSLDADSFLWDFGDGDTSNEVDPVHVYPVADTYLVTLTATNENGSDSASAFVTVPAP